MIAKEVMETNWNQFQIMKIRCIWTCCRRIIKKMFKIYFMGRMINKAMIRRAKPNYIQSIMAISIIKIGILEKVQYFLITRRDNRNLIKSLVVQVCSTNLLIILASRLIRKEWLAQLSLDKNNSMKWKEIVIYQLLSI